MPHPLPEYAAPLHKTADLEQLFYKAFNAGYRTRLMGGADEPLYQPATVQGGENLLFYREDFFASALHEIAHWCIAGESRLDQVDFGYWYLPEGRTTAQQKQFELVEVKPQALEWIFSVAAGYPFRLSRDNFSNNADIDSAFPKAVQSLAKRWCQQSMPKRGELFAKTLQHFYQNGNAFDSNNYQLLPE